jgi:hypothetical protein
MVRSSGFEPLRHCYRQPLRPVSILNCLSCAFAPESNQDIKPAQPGPGSKILFSSLVLGRSGGIEVYPTPIKPCK